MAALDFYYFPASTYTYLTVNRIEERAAKAQVDVRWRPYNLRLFLRETGTTPFPRGSAKEQHMWRDLERRAERLDIPFTAPLPTPSIPI